MQPQLMTEPLIYELIGSRKQEIYPNRILSYLILCHLYISWITAKTLPLKNASICIHEDRIIRIEDIKLTPNHEKALSVFMHRKEIHVFFTFIVTLCNTCVPLLVFRTNVYPMMYIVGICGHQPIVRSVQFVRYMYLSKIPNGSICFGFTWDSWAWPSDEANTSISQTPGKRHINGSRNGSCQLSGWGQFSYVHMQ